MREGQGSYFYAQKNKLFVGEYVEDMPKVGIYTEVDDGKQNSKEDKLRNFDDIPPIPVLGLRDPVGVLESSFKKLRQKRIFYRARYMSINLMFQEEELTEMIRFFKSFAQTHINHLQVLQALEMMGIELDRKMILKD